jgi:hypothetical protein
MLLFLLWTAIAITVLISSGYSHYRYRVKNNQCYQRFFTRERMPEQGPLLHAYPAHSQYAFPALMLMIAFLLVPMSLAI